jgi:hypothetical protein
MPFDSHEQALNYTKFRTGIGDYTSLLLLKILETEVVCAIIRPDEFTSLQRKKK